jgi:hypothetical protein
MGGEVIAARRAFEALDAKGGQEVADINLARRAFVEVGGASQFKEVTFVEEDVGDGEEWGWGVLGAELDAVWVHRLTIVYILL